MKILFVNTTYGVGSTGKLMRSFLNYANEQGHEVAAVFADGNLDAFVKAIKVKDNISRKATILLERLTGLTGWFSPWSTKRAVHFLDEYKPDIIYLGNLHGYYINIYDWYKEISKRNIPCVQIMWDEFPMTGSCAFTFECEKYKSICSKCQYRNEYPISYLFDQSKYLQKKKSSSYSDNNVVFVSVPYTVSKARDSYLLKNKKLIALDEAIDQKNIFYPKNVQLLRKSLKLTKDSLIILNVCVYPSERKGGKYYLELARKCLEYKDIVFIHVGFNGNKDDCPSNYIPIGFVSNQDELADYYSLADLFVCTSLAETQPNTCLEALSCGTPICGFDISGVPTCAEEPYGRFVEVGNTDLLKDIVVKANKKTDESCSYIRKYAESRFSSDIYNEKLIQLGCKMVNE